jgi:GNAT superfamily N-acetyltransferase
VESCRPAIAVDVETIASLARDMLAELAPMKGGRLYAAREARPEPLEPAYAALLERDDALVVVGAIDDVIVGFGVVELESLRTGERLGVIDDLYVEPEARSVGVGDAIVAVLADFCREHGCTGIDARALPGHRSTKNFFEGHGFTARALIMHHSLVAPAEPEPLGDGA